MLTFFTLSVWSLANGNKNRVVFILVFSRLRTFSNLFQFNINVWHQVIEWAIFLFGFGCCCHVQRKNHLSAKLQRRRRFLKIAHICELCHEEIFFAANFFDLKFFNGTCDAHVLLLFFSLFLFKITIQNNSNKHRQWEKNRKHFASILRNERNKQQSKAKLAAHTTLNMTGWLNKKMNNAVKIVLASCCNCALTFSSYLFWMCYFICRSICGHIKRFEFGWCA